MPRGASSGASGSCSTWSSTTPPTSIPWFRSARSSPDSPYRDWYVWSDDEPPDRRQGIVFPGEQTETWTYDDEAGAWYFHRFYDFQPDLNWSNPAVRGGDQAR